MKVNISQSFSYIEDYIMGVTDSLIPAMNYYAKGIRVYSNIPAAMLYGADLQIHYNPIEDLSFFNTTKYTFGEIKNGKPLPLISPLKNILSMQYLRNRWMVQAENETSLAQNRINYSYGEQKTPVRKI